jgi:hypothetical protein
MRKWNFVTVCAVVAVYVILITLFAMLERDFSFTNDKDEKFNNCSYPNACLTFCEGADYEKYSAEFIWENFPYKDFPKLKNDNDKTKFRLVKHKIECEKPKQKRILSDYNDWTMYYVIN